MESSMSRFKSSPPTSISAASVAPPLTPGRPRRRSPMRQGAVGVFVRSIPLVSVLVAVCAVAASAAPPADHAKIDPWIESRLRHVAEDSFIVLFDDAETLRHVVAAAKSRRPE